MSLMDWDLKKFDVSVPAMNRQHEGLVAVMNSLYERHKAKAGKDELDKLLVKLRDLTVKHFHDEETYFDSIGFPLADNHRRIHQKLVEDFVKHYEGFTATGVLSDGFFSFLRLWLTSHIMHIDRKYGEFSQQRGAA
jgi:hemerythrin